MLLLITIATALVWLSSHQASIDVVFDYDCYCSDAIIPSVLGRVLMLLLITIATALMWLSRPQASIDVVIDYNWYCSGAIISSSGEYWCCYWLRLLLLWCDYLVLGRVLINCYWLRLLLLCCDYLVLRRVLMLLLITIGTALMWLSRPRASIDIVIDYDWYCSGVII